MSFEQNYGTYFKPYDIEIEPADADYEMEVLEVSIDNYLANVEIEQREIIEADKRRVD